MCMHVKQHSFSLIYMFWPFPGFLVNTMTSAWKNQYRQPRCRVRSSQFDAVYMVKGFVLYKFVLGQKTILAPWNFLETTSGNRPGHVHLSKHCCSKRLPSCNPFDVLAHVFARVLARSLRFLARPRPYLRGPRSIRLRWECLVQNPLEQLSSLASFLSRSDAS
jgi:hypothetical protein